jgi:hydrogenase expression/formation protein HypC
MCIGFPLQVIEAWRDGALVAGRGRVESVDTRLVGPVQPGDWLEAGLAGDADGAAADPGFALPSAMSAEQLAALTGAPSGDPR